MRTRYATSLMLFCPSSHHDSGFLFKWRQNSHPGSRLPAWPRQRPTAALLAPFFLPTSICNPCMTFTSHNVHLPANSTSLPTRNFTCLCTAARECSLWWVRYSQRKPVFSMFVRKIWEARSCGLPRTWASRCTTRRMVSIVALSFFLLAHSLVVYRAQNLSRLALWPNLHVAYAATNFPGTATHAVDLGPGSLSGMRAQSRRAWCSSCRCRVKVVPNFMIQRILCLGSMFRSIRDIFGQVLCPGVMPFWACKVLFYFLPINA